MKQAGTPNSKVNMSLLKGCTGYTSDGMEDDRRYVVDRHWHSNITNTNTCKDSWLNDNNPDITINSSANAPLNAKKIAVKKVSDVGVSMFGPELKFSMYKCCYLACFCASQRAQRLRTELTLAVADCSVTNLWTDPYQICRFIWEWTSAKKK